MLRYLRSLARTSLNAVVKIVELRGGVMLSMAVPADTAPDEPDARLCIIDDMAQLNETWPLQVDVTARRLRQGDVLYCLVDHEDLCSYCWVSRQGSRIDVFLGRSFEVPEAAIYIWDCATLRAHRNRGYYRTVLKGIQSAEPDVSAAYAAVDQLNHVSRRALEWAGFSPCFRYWGVRILRRHAVSVALWKWRPMGLEKALSRLTGLRGDVF